MPPERTTEDGDRPKRARRTALMPSSPAMPSEPLDEPRPRLTEAEERAAKSIIVKMRGAPVDPPILRSNDRVETNVVECALVMHFAQKAVSDRSLKSRFGVASTTDVYGRWVSGKLCRAAQARRECVGWARGHLCAISPAAHRHRLPYARR